MCCVGPGLNARAACAYRLVEPDLCAAILSTNEIKNPLPQAIVTRKMDDVITSYTKAEYCVYGVEEPITIGKPGRPADDLLRPSKSAAWSFITAWNPLSVQLSEKENLARNEDLKSDLSRYQIFEGEARDPAGGWGPEKSFLALGISLREAKRLGRKHGQRAVVFGRYGGPAELIETIFTLGNHDLIRLEKTAFVCSRTAPPETAVKCIDWAVKQREMGRCVISGFHSLIERAVLQELLKGVQPVIQVLARGLKLRVEPELAEALNEGRLLVITPYDERTLRASSATASVRNALIIDLANEVWCGHAEDSGLLSSLLKASEKRLKFV